MYKKNAYLIMAHNDFSILKKILKVLDDDESDFYIHIDKKSDFQNKSEFELYLKKSKIYFIDSMDITWGGRSQIDLEIALSMRNMHICVYGLDFDFVGEVGNLSWWS